MAIFAVGFILLIVAETVGVMQRGIQFPSVRQSLVPYQIIVLLVVIVGLVVVKSRVTGGILIFSAWIIAPPVLLHVGFRSVIPCMISLFCAIEGDELHHGIIVEIASLHEIRVQTCRRSVYITVATDIG